MRPMLVAALAAGAAALVAHDQVAAHGAVASHPALSLPGARAVRSTTEDSLVRAEPNDNRRPAGTIRGGVATVNLVARRARWYPEEENGPSLVTDALGEEGQPPTVPAPLIRVPAGTQLVVRVRNALPDTLFLFGLRSRSESDSVQVAPGASVEMRGVAPPPGAYVYRGATLVNGELRDQGYGQQLAGALVVDTPNAAPDRVFMISSWQVGPGGFVMAINGKSWPYTERVTLNVGDSVHWRVLSNSKGLHPMHLHGFYYRVDSRGSWEADTIYAPEQRRYVVTEIVPADGSFSLTWKAERPGNWLFHCHDALHITWRRRANLRALQPTSPAQAATHDAHHADEDMSGLVIGIRVNPAGAEQPVVDEPVRRRVRLVVTEKPGFYRQLPGLSFVRADARDPAPDSLEIPGRPLVLTRGERAQITVVNRASSPTAVHWHGIELESYFDGVAGFSGDGARTTPLIVPSDSFIARFTPPRAGTFIYHAHVDDLREIALGLYGPLIVLEPGATYDPMIDHTLVFSQLGLGAQSIVGLNGMGAPPSLELGAGVRHRLRFINISVQDFVDVRLLADSTPVVWRALAKDGRDLQPRQAIRGPARLRFGPGETYDFELSLPSGDYRLRVDTFNHFDVAVRVR